MIAVDTNILVYAHRRDSEWHRPAAAAISGLAEDRGIWAIPWPSLYEFIAVVTHPRIYAPPSTTQAALEQVAVWAESPSLVLLAEDDGCWSTLSALIQRAAVTGPQVHDARIAALCIYHGVRELWTADRDFSRFPQLPSHNPLIEGATPG